MLRTGVGWLNRRSCVLSGLWSSKWDSSYICMDVFINPIDFVVSVSVCVEGTMCRDSSPPLEGPFPDWYPCGVGRALAGQSCPNVNHTLSVIYLSMPSLSLGSENNAHVPRIQVVEGCVCR